MIKLQNIVNVSTGTTQSQRLLPALDPSFFSVDERGQSDMLAFVAKFAKSLGYFNSRNELEGNWMNLFLTDPTILTAYVMKTDRYMELAKFLDYADGITATSEDFTKRLFTQQFYSIGFHIVLRINRWYELSKGTHTMHPFRKYLRNIIEEKGRVALRDYYACYFFLTENINGFRNQALLKMEALDRKWFFEPFPQVEKVTIETIGKEQVDEAVQKGQVLFKLQEEIIKAAAVFYEASLQRDNIPPHVGLLLTFTDLYKYQQQSLNKITRRHLDFYYKQVLGFLPQAAQPDQVFITFQVAKDTKQYVLPAGTKLAAGKDKNGKNVVFLTQKNQNLTATTISKVNTLYFNKTADGVLQGLYKGSLEKYSQVPGVNWPFFGAVQDDNPNLKIAKTTLGASFSSPDLLLSSGERQLSITFSTTVGDTTEFVAADPALNIFDVYVTSPKGWTQLKSCTVNKNASCSKIKVDLSLGFEEPAIVAYNETIHGKGYQTVWPVCRFVLKENASVADYHFVRSFKFKQVNTSATVKGNKNFVLQNSKGKSSPSIPFLPFGSNPQLQSSLFIGGQEFFVKPLSCFEIEIQWDAYPDSFEDYYSDYNEFIGGILVFTDEAFTATLSLLDKNTAGEVVWTPLENGAGSSAISLFQKDGFSNSCMVDSTTNNEGAGADATDGAEASDSTTTVTGPLNKKLKLIAIDLSGKTTILPELPLIQQYSEKYRSAFFKFSFTAPQEGFGNDIYPKVVSQITLENAEIAIKEAGLLRKTIKVIIKVMSAILVAVLKNMLTKALGLMLKTIKKSVGAVASKSKKVIGKLTGALKKAIKKIGSDVKDDVKKVAGKVEGTKSKTNASEVTSVEKASKDKKKAVPESNFKPLPNKPYIPKAKSVSINYSSNNEWVVSTADQPFQWYSIDQSVVTQVDVDKKIKAGESVELTLLPDYSRNGYASLELKNVQPGEEVNMLVAVTSQLNSVSNALKETIFYEYLSAEGWKLFYPQQDRTYGFEQSGIISFILNEAAEITFDAKNNSYAQIRISSTGNSVIVDFLSAQAAVAVRDVSGVTSFDWLTAGVIKKTVDSNAAIKKIIQPLPSTSGHAAENDEEFYHRVAYRINNKDRAGNLKDIEQLVLQQFSSIYKVTAIASGQINAEKSGQVKVVVVPFVQSTDKNIYKPLPTPATLRSVFNFLEPKMIQGVLLEIARPSFLFIKISVDVEFDGSAVGGFLKEELIQDLNAFLSPWVIGNQFANEQAQYWSSAAIFSFIKNRPYVKYATHFSSAIYEEIKDTGQLRQVNQVTSGALVVPLGEYAINSVALSKMKNDNLTKIPKKVVKRIN